LSRSVLQTPGVMLAMPNAIYMETSGPQKIKNGEMAAPEEPGQ